MATVGHWRDKAWGHKIDEPDWDTIFNDPEEVKDRVKSAAEEQKRLIAEARARNGGKLGRS